MCPKWGAKKLEKKKKKKKKKNIFFLLPKMGKMVFYLKKFFTIIFEFLFSFPF